MFEKEQRARDKQLLKSAVKRFGLGIIMLGLLLFLCAGDIHYWNAWLYLAAFSLAIFSFGIYLYQSDKELLRKRLSAKEKEEEQKAYNVTAGIALLATFSVCGVDHRCGWSHVPPMAVAIAFIAMMAGYGLFVLVMVQNRFASRVVEVQQGQRVVDTGMYSIVRHPLYTAALIMFFSSPVVLGSYYAIIPVFFFWVGSFFG